MKNITIPSSVTTIGDDAFSSCSKLTEITVQAEKPPTLTGSTIFQNMATPPAIKVPAGSIEAYKTDANWSAYAKYMSGY